MTTGDLRQKGYAIQVLLERGLERYRTGATSLALNMWEEALAVDPDEPRALTYIDYVRQNWDEVDGNGEAPLPDISNLIPNFPVDAAAPVAVAAAPAPVVAPAPVAAPAAVPAPVVAPAGDVLRFDSAPLEAVPDTIHDAPTPRGTIEYRLGGVAGDGWGLAPESLLRQAAQAAPLAEPPPALDLQAPATLAGPDELTASEALTPLADSMPELAEPTPAAPADAPAVEPEARVAASDADFDRDLEDALGAVASSPALELPALAVDGVVVPELAGDVADDFDDDADLDLPPPVADLPVVDSDPFGEEKPTVWTPRPQAPAPLMTLAERVEQAMARDADPFAEDRVTTSWQAPPASLLAAARGEEPATAPPAIEPRAAAAEPPDLAAELAAQLMAEPMLAPAPLESPAVEPVAAARPSAAELALDHSLDLAFSEPAAAEPAPPAPVVEPAVAVAAEPTAAELEDSIFDRVTPVPPIDNDEIAIAPSEPPRRITLPMGSPLASSPTAPTPVDYGTDDIELAPRSGVGLGHDVGDAKAASEPVLSTDDVGPLERAFHRPSSPPPAVPPEPSGADEMSLEDDDLMAAEGEDGPAAIAAAPPAVAVEAAPAAVEPPIAEVAPAVAVEAAPAVTAADDDDDDELGPASSRARTRDLRPLAPDEPEASPAPPLGLELETEPTAGLDLDPEEPASTPALRIPPVAEPRPEPVRHATTLIGVVPPEFDGAEARTVTIVPDLGSIELATPLHGAPAPAPADSPFGLADGEDPFDLPTAPITPLPEPPARVEVRADDGFAIELPEPGRDERVNRAPTLDLAARVPTPRMLPEASELDEQPTVAGGPRAKTLELVPTTIAPLWAPSGPPAPAPAPSGFQHEGGYQADTADLVPRFPSPPHDLAAPVALATPPLPSRDQVDTVDLGIPVHGWDAETNVMQFGRRLESAPAWQPLPLPPVTPTDGAPGGADADRGDAGLAAGAGSSESLDARLSPAVLRGLGLTPMAEGATTDEPTRDGWPVATRRPAFSSSSPTAPAEVAGAADLSDDPLAMEELELPLPRAGIGTRTPSEVLLRSSAPEALAVALASELDRGAPTGESPDDRSRRRITALLDRASAAARAGEHPMAIAAIDLALSEAPDSAVAQKLVHRSRDIILDCYQRYFGDLSRRPVPVGSLSDLTGRPLDPRAAFLVSRMDGNLSYEEILDVAGMGRLEACRHLAQLLVRGIIRAT